MEGLCNQRNSDHNFDGLSLLYFSVASLDAGLRPTNTLRSNRRRLLRAKRTNGCTTTIVTCEKIDTYGMIEYLYAA